MYLKNVSFFCEMWQLGPVSAKNDAFFRKSLFLIKNEHDEKKLHFFEFGRVPL